MHARRGGRVFCRLAYPTACPPRDRASAERACCSGDRARPRGAYAPETPTPKPEATSPRTRARREGVINMTLTMQLSETEGFEMGAERYDIQRRAEHVVLRLLPRERRPGYRQFLEFTVELSESEARSIATQLLAPWGGARS